MKRGIIGSALLIGLGFTAIMWWFVILAIIHDGSVTIATPWGLPEQLADIVALTASTAVNLAALRFISKTQV